MTERDELETFLKDNEGYAPWKRGGLYGTLNVRGNFLHWTKKPDGDLLLTRDLELHQRQWMELYPPRR